MIRFIEVINDTDFNPRMERTAQLLFTMSEIWINEAYVISVRSAPEYRKLLEEGRLPSDLDHQHEFAVVTTHNGNLTETHVVVGNVSSVASRLGNDTRRLLKG